MGSVLLHVIALQLLLMAFLNCVVLIQIRDIMHNFTDLLYVFVFFNYCMHVLLRIV